MEDEIDHICLCCLRGIMPTISRKWAICIITEIGRHQPMRFSEIMKNCGEISPKSLADVLKDLHNARLIERVSYAEIPPRVEYILTREGNDLIEAIGPLLKWAKQYNRLYLSYRNFSVVSAPDP